MTSNYRDQFGEVLADHHESPRCYGHLDQPTQTEEGYNPLCGDKVKMTLLLSADQKDLKKMMFEGEGCSICMASASILAERVQGKPVLEVQTLIEAFRNKMQGAEVVAGIPDENDMSDDLTALYGIKRFPVRIKCALLAWTTLKLGMQHATEKTTS